MDGSGDTRSSSDGQPRSGQGRQTGGSGTAVPGSPRWIRTLGRAGFHSNQKCSQQIEGCSAGASGVGASGDIAINTRQIASAQYCDQCWCKGGLLLIVNSPRYG